VRERRGGFAGLEDVSSARLRREHSSIASYKVVSSGRSKNARLDRSLFAAIIDAGTPRPDRRLDVGVMAFKIKEASVDRIDFCREFNGCVDVRFTILVEFEYCDGTVYRAYVVEK